MLDRSSSSFHPSRRRPRRLRPERVKAREVVVLCKPLPVLGRDPPWPGTSAPPVIASPRQRLTCLRRRLDSAYSPAASIHDLRPSTGAMATLARVAAGEGGGAAPSAGRECFSTSRATPTRTHTSVTLAAAPRVEPRRAVAPSYSAAGIRGRRTRLAGLLGSQQGAGPLDGIEPRRRLRVDLGPDPTPRVARLAVLRGHPPLALGVDLPHRAARVLGREPLHRAARAAQEERRQASGHDQQDPRDLHHGRAVRPPHPAVFSFGFGRAVDILSEKRTRKHSQLTRPKLLLA